MKIKIDKGGDLLIERAGIFRSALCPLQQWSAIQGFRACGDWCPLFGEPEALGDGLGRIYLCRSCIEGEITDERGGK